MALGERIKKVRREQLALTQLELANRLGIDPVNVSRWERGVAEPRLRYVREIASLAELPVEFFFDEDEPKAAA